MEEIIHLFPVRWESKNQIINVGRGSSQLITEWSAKSESRQCSYSCSLPWPRGVRTIQVISQKPQQQVKLFTIKICFMKVFSCSFYNCLISLHSIHLDVYLRPPYSTSTSFYWQTVKTRSSCVPDVGKQSWGYTSLFWVPYFPLCWAFGHTPSSLKPPWDTWNSSILYPRV